MFIGYPIDCSDSDAIYDLSANPLTGTVQVTFWSGMTTYRFDGVSRRAILSLLSNSNRSLGQWVNRHCIPTDAL